MALDKADDEENRRRTFCRTSRIFRGVQRRIKTFITFVALSLCPAVYQLLQFLACLKEGAPLLRHGDVLPCLRITSFPRTPLPYPEAAKPSYLYLVSACQCILDTVKQHINYNLRLLLRESVC